MNHRYPFPRTLRCICIACLFALCAEPLSAARTGSRNIQIIASTPVLGAYPDTSVALGSNTAVTPSAVPADAAGITASSDTSFKGKLTADPVTGIVRITNAHPANISPGVYPVTVRAFGPGGTATATFNLTVTVPNGTGCSGTLPGFVSAADPDLIGLAATSVAVGDFNHDGKQDIAIADNSTDAFVIQLGNGLGGSSGTAYIALPLSPISLAVGDFNNDGNEDIAVGTEGDHVFIFLGDGLGGFTEELSYNGGGYSVAVGDFNNDGNQDIVGAAYPSNIVLIALGDGLGGFSEATEVEVGAGALSVAIGDFNSDGKQDLAVANNGSNTVSIRLGNGLGGFSGTTEVAVGAGPLSVAVGDFNGDGIQDIAVANMTRARSRSGSATALAALAGPQMSLSAAAPTRSRSAISATTENRTSPSPITAQPRSRSGLATGLAALAERQKSTPASSRIRSRSAI